MGSQAGLEFKKAVENRRIIRFAKAKALVDKELQAAQDDLSEAEDRNKNQKYKYATIMAYYSMFHAARALIYSKGYREKSHYYLFIALKYLFTESGLLKEELVEDFYSAMMLREGADYHGEFSPEGAHSSIESASRFLQQTKTIFKNTRPKPKTT
jgi:uncharacterized protein (UPF0332 family)